MKVLKLFFTLIFFLLSHESFSMFEFDVLTERMCDKLCRGDNITNKDLEEWIETASPDHLRYVNEEYKINELNDNEKKELFDAMCTVILYDIPTNSGKNHFEHAIKLVKDRKYSCLFVIFDHMPKTMLCNT